MTLNPKYLKGCVLAFDFAELQGDKVYDLSGNNNHGTIYGAMWRKGPLIGALSFDGVNDYVEVPDSPSLRVVGESSWEAWVYVRGYTERYANIVGKDGWGEGALMIDKNNKVVFDQGDGTIWEHVVYSTFPLELNKWYHVVAVKTGGTAGVDEVRLYINGVYNNKGTLKLNTGTRENSVLIGYWSSYLNGIVGMARIYNRILTVKEIREHYYYVFKPCFQPRFPIFYRYKRPTFVPAIA